MKRLECLPLQKLHQTVSCQHLKKINQNKNHIIKLKNLIWTIDSPSNQTKVKSPSKGNSSPLEKSKEAGNKIAGQTKNGKLSEKSLVDASKSNQVKSIIDAPSNLLKEKNKIEKKEKYFAAPKVVEKAKVIEYTKVNTVLVDKMTEPENNREQRVVDELINSGNYDVYDDGKYIKFSKKK